MNTAAQKTRIDAYDYDLPDERIARYPLANREMARQLHYRDGKITEAPFKELPDYLPAKTLLVGNRTRVIHARLHFPLPGDERPIEIFCLDPLEPFDYAVSLGSMEAVKWKCLIGGNRRWKEGKLVLRQGNLQLTAERTARIENAFEIVFTWQADAPLSFGEVVARCGSIPLPPYLGRPSETADEERYQTVFAREEGSVAAPTAGLHFTPEVISALGRKSINWSEVTLHVGAGTFKPVTSPTLGEHIMHREFFTVTTEFIERLARQLKAGDPIVSVGTTSMRTLESLYYFGAILIRDGKLPRHLDQWVATEDSLTATATDRAITVLAEKLRSDGESTFNGYTQLLLTPAAKIRVVDGLITNFHQPRSTLLLLVAAMIGDHWKDVYDYALENDFRFLSYGDSSLLWRSGLTFAE